MILKIAREQTCPCTGVQVSNKMIDETLKKT